MYIYQGEELGLPEVEDIPDDRRQDPMWLRSGGVDPGRDGCRVPLPLGRRCAALRLQPRGLRRPWLDPPDDWAALTVERVRGRDLDARPLPHGAARPPRRPVVGRRHLRWLEGPESVVIFARGERFVCLVNFGPEPVELPAGASVLISSNELEGGSLPQDTTVWLRQTRAAATPRDP